MRDFAAAAVYLDLGALPPTSRTEDGPTLARKFKVVLDQLAWIDLESLSEASAGQLDDGLPPDIERVAQLATPQGSVDVLLHRSDVAGTSVWRISASTVGRIPALYDEFGYGLIGELFPGGLPRARFLEVQLWQWLGLLVSILLAWVLSLVAVGALRRAFRPFVARTASTLDDRVLDLTVGPLRLLASVAIFALCTPALHLAVPAREVMVSLQRGVTVAAMAWLFMRLVDVGAEMVRQHLTGAGKHSALTVLPLGEKTVKVAVLGLASLVMLQNLGFNITGLLAGLGVGGLALALAAQKTVENLFGGVSLITDQPVRVGDFCRYGEKVGTVEDIGLRSTRIRSLDRTLVTVPNSEFAYLQLENFAARDRIRFVTTLGLRYETTPDQMRWVLAELRRLLLSHPRVLPDPARVRFTGYGDYSLNLEIFAYVSSTDFNEYLSIQEDLLLRIMDIVSASGTGFAFPSNTTYLAHDAGNDEERARRAEEQVAAWRETGELPFPDFRAATRTGLAGTLDFPPRGSAVALPDSESTR